MKFGRIEIEVTSLSCELVPDKLAKEGIPVFSVKKTGKNRISFQTAAKDREKVFAILRGSCYNIGKVRGRGLNLLYKKCRKNIGLGLGAALFCILVLSAQTRIFKINVVGSGAYYEEQILQLLEENGVKTFSKAPFNVSAISAQILALPRVSYCEIGSDGGILTVEVRVSGETPALSTEPLYAPATGKIEEITVLRGTLLVREGDEVEQGQLLVENYAMYGAERREVLVIAQVKISFGVNEYFEGNEEQARSGAYLKYGEIQEIHTERSGDGFLVSGTAFAEASVNLN